MVTKRIFQALMITGTMIVSTTIVEAQRFNREGLHKLSQRGGVSPAVKVHAPTIESNHEIKSPLPAPEDGQTGLLNITAQSKKAKAIVGSWLDTVTVTDGPTFKSLSTYVEDGGWMFNDQGSVVTDPTFPHVFSTGQGVWTHQGGRTFRQAALQLLSDLGGELLGINRVTQTLVLNESGDAYSVTWKSDFIDPDGNLVVTVEGTIEGRRISAASLP
jgi:hypothetical protein